MKRPRKSMLSLLLVLPIGTISFLLWKKFSGKTSTPVLVKKATATAPAIPITVEDLQDTGLKVAG